MKLICCKVFTFDMAHRLYNHESKCLNFHGHTYRLEVYCKAKNNNLDDLGRIVDFGMIDAIVKQYLEKWDHNICLNDKDRKIGELIEKEQRKQVIFLPCNPTAENMIQVFFRELNDAFNCNYNAYRCDNNAIQICKLRLYETPKCFVELTNELDSNKSNNNIEESCE